MPPNRSQADVSSPQPAGAPAKGNGRVMHSAKANPRREYHLKQRESIEASPLLKKQFPLLKGLNVRLEFFNSAGTTKNGELKCKLNVDFAKSVLWFGCPGGACEFGGFELTQAVADAVRGKRRSARGELRCPGMRKRGDEQPVPCQTLLRYHLTLQYD